MNGQRGKRSDTYPFFLFFTTGNARVVYQNFKTNSWKMYHVQVYILSIPLLVPLLLRFSLFLSSRITLSFVVFNHFHQAWFKTSGFSGGVQVAILDPTTGNNRNFNSFSPAATQDWTVLDFTFNSMVLYCFVYFSFIFLIYCCFSQARL